MTERTALESIHRIAGEALGHLAPVEDIQDDPRSSVGTVVEIKRPAATGWFFSVDSEGGRESAESLGVNHIRAQLQAIAEIGRNSPTTRQRANELLTHPVFNSRFVGRFLGQPTGTTTNAAVEFWRDITDSQARAESTMLRAGGPASLVGARDATLPPLVDYRDQNTWSGYTGRKPGDTIAGFLLVPFSEPGDDDRNLVEFTFDLCVDYLDYGPKPRGRWVPGDA